MIVRLPNDGPAPNREEIAAQIKARLARKAAEQESVKAVIVAKSRARRPVVEWSALGSAIGRGGKIVRTSVATEAKLASIVMAVKSGFTISTEISQATGMKLEHSKKMATRAVRLGLLFYTAERVGKTTRYTYSVTAKGYQLVDRTDQQVAA